MKDKISGIIYKATNIINGKVYIGQTVQGLEKRKNGHLYYSKNTDTHFARAISKYGENNFIWEVIDKAYTRKSLNKKECYWIKEYDSGNPENGYNMTIGGEGINALSEEVKNKIGKANKGKKRTEETKQKMSESQLGKTIPWKQTLKRLESRKGYKHSEETKQKMRHPHNIINSWVGRKHTSEAVEKIRKANTGKIHSEETRNKISLIVKKQWEDKEYREKVSEGHKKHRLENKGFDK